MDIILIRHGESEANTKKIYGGKDVKLTEKGINQAKTTSKYINNLRDKKTYVSPYIRAIETMEYLGLNGEIEESIKEVDFGIGLGKTYKELLEEYPKAVKAWNDDPINYRLPKGESLVDGYERVSKYLNKLIEKDEDVVLICHDGVIRLALCYIFDKVDYFYRFKSDNLSLTKITIDDGYKYINYQNRIYY